MNTCLKPNFSAKTDLGEITSTSLFKEYKDIDLLINNIKSGLKEKSFSTAIDESQDETKYEKSINDLITAILNKLSEQKSDLTESDKNLVRNELYKFLLPTNLTIVKDEVAAIIPDAELYSEQERKNREYSDIVDEFFKDNLAARNRREEIIAQTLLELSIIDVRNKVIVTNSVDLNKNLERFKSDQYLILKRYLEKLGYSTYATGMYSNHKLNSTSFNRLLKDAYNYIQELINNPNKSDNLKTKLRDSWLDSLNGKSSELYDFVNAYINLMYFDKVLENSLGNYIRINESLNEPITLEKTNTGTILTKYKYSFNSGNASAVKGWETAENRDAIKEMGKYSKLLIESIPFYNYQTKAKLNINLNPVRFSNTISKLLDLSNELDSITYKEFLDLMHTRHFKSEQNFPKILDMILKNEKGLRTELKRLGLNDFDLNVLYSIKKRLYEGAESYNTIELKFESENGLLTSYYPIVKTLLGVVDSVVSMNYLQHKYNVRDEEYQTSIKTKYPTDKLVYEIVTHVNRETVNRTNKEALLEKYKLQLQGSNYDIVLENGTKYTVKVRRNSLGALTKTSKTTKSVTIDGIPDSIDLSNKEIRGKLLSGKNLTEDESKFMDMLSFIDTMLSTTFSKDDDGLIRFGVFSLLDSNGLENLLLAASRALIITDIYNKFDRSRVLLNLTKQELGKFLEENLDVYNGVNFKTLPKNDRRHLLKQGIVGEYLTTIAASEQWLHNLSHADAILSGEISKAVIKNLENDSIPNISPSFEGSFIKKRSYQAHNLANASGYLLFSEEQDSIKKVVIDTDISVQDGRKVSVKNMSKGELLYHSIVDKYFLPLLELKKHIIIQPTTYSDKTKFINYFISTTIKAGDLTKLSSDEIENLIIQSLGLFYKTIWNNVLSDYEKLFGTRDVKEISSKLKELSLKAKELSNILNKKVTAEEMLMELGNLKGVEIHVDTHYRIINGNLQINELLNHYATHAYNKEELHKRLYNEKIKFIESLIKNRVHFNMAVNDTNEIINTKNDMTTILIDKLGSNLAKAWVSGLKMILAKVRDGSGKVTRNIVYGTKINLKPGETLELNPLLDNYFMVHTLVGNNIRHILSGSEINHKIKELGKQNLSKTSFASFTKVLEQYGITDLSTASLVDIDYAIKNMEVSDNKNDNENALKLREIYNSHIYTLESQAQNALLKRNVIIPATLSYYLQGTLNGITAAQKVAVINDIPAEVFNFDGISSTIDAHDGAALEDPFTSRLENLSLLDREVGTIKKPIWHHYDHRYGTAFLGKYAVHTMTNQWMRQSELSTVSLLNLFKRMTNLQWNEEIDLLDGCAHRKGSIDFRKNILENRRLFYKKGNKHYEIIGFDRDAKGYYTIEQEVSFSGNSLNNGVGSTKVYHFFDKLGNHYNTDDVTVNGNKVPVHTINSLYELHTSLGGIWCESLTENGLLYSEASVNAVVNFMNEVTVLKPGMDAKTAPKDQHSYRLPLKEYVISYAANNSSIKNGAANRNSNKVFTEPYTGENDLYYMIVSTEGHGILMDADHTADEAQMTEFSQVISSLDAGGRLHNYVKLIYDVLGKVAIELSQLEIQALEEYKESGNISAIYDIIGRTIINNISSKSGQAGLAEAIIKNIKKHFDLNSDHAFDELKIPFSDPNIYSNIISTFVSIINNKSIKRKYPGQGTVMVPGYNMSQVWEIDGQIYQYEDLVKKAQKSLDNIGSFDNITDISLYNKAIVKSYLEGLLSKVEVVDNLDSFMPTDSVDILIDGKYKDTISLTSIKDYYEFKKAPSVFLLQKGIAVTTNDKLTYRKNITKARDLAPAKIAFIYLANGVKKQTNIFDTWALVDAYERGLKRSDPEVQANVQKILDGLEENKYYHEDGDKVDNNGDRYFEVTSITNTPAELIMSNIYKSKFRIKDGESLVDVLNNPLSFAKPQEIVKSDFYDLVFTKGNGKHLYITFNRLKPASESFDFTRKVWNYINRSKFNKIPDTYTYNPKTKTYDNAEGSNTILNKVYATDRDNIRQFEIGRDIINSEVYYDENDRKFKDKEGKVLSNQKRFRRISSTEVSEYVEFVHKNEVIEDGKTYTTYNIDKTALSRVLAVKDPSKADEEINKYISKLLGKIYKALNYNGVHLLTNLKRKSAILLESTLKGFGNELAYDSNLKQLIYDLQGLLLGATQLPIDEKTGKPYYGNYVIAPIKYNSKQGIYLKNLRTKIAASFEKAQYFTASRIPAQTLQSFMQMKCVGFTGTDTNQCFVSHWQTWLQGSDYDIDKAYIMGHNFDDNGVYIGWSNIFNYSSLEAIKASEQLPMPTGRKYYLKEDGYDLTQYEEAYANADEVGKIKILTKIINDLNNIKSEDGKLYVNSTNDSVIYQSIISHENTQLPQDLKLASYKNFISSHIENTIQNLRNMIGAYTPIDMEIIRDASKDHSSKGSSSGTMTLSNPAVIYEMQYENMVGKKVIGITATGEKASFMWHYWLNDIVRTNKEGYEKYGKFQHSLDRIQGRSSGVPITTDVNILPDVNLEGVELDDVLRLTGIIPVDGMISQTLSAATDNAKELILAKINAGSKLAKCYLYLITMGYNINDIVSFMTSDVITFIDTFTESNIYEDLNLTIDQVIELAEGKIHYSIEKHFGINSTGKFKKKNYENCLTDKTVNLVNPYEPYESNYLKVQNFIDFINEVKSHRPDIESSEDMKNDIQDFKKVLEGADEFSNFGRLLGLNQGLPTSKVDLRKLLDTIKNIVTSREKALGLIDKNGAVNKEKVNELGLNLEFSEIIGKFDVTKFLTDDNYKNLIIDYQNAIKANIPIFKIINDIPQFNSILKLLGTIVEIDHVTSVKSKLFDDIMDKFKEKKYFVDEYMQKGVLSFIDDLLILDFLKSNEYLYPIESGSETIDSIWRNKTVGTSISLTTPDGIASFKTIFENIVIPNLKEGFYWDGKRTVHDENLKTNKFILDLIRTVDGEIPLYKANIDMLAKDNSANNIAKFNDYVLGLRMLQNNKINGIPLSDWFMIYNLIVNKNNYGSDRLTTLLLEFISEGHSNFLTEYLNHIGKLDYDLKVNILYSLEDALIATAKTVNSTYGHKEPMLLVMTENGPELQIYENFNYRKFDQLIPPISGETKELQLQRLLNRIEYGTLRVNYNSYINDTIKKLNNLDQNTITILKDLVKQGAIVLNNICT